MKKTITFLLFALMTFQASAQGYHCDVNNDGVVDVSDLYLVIDKILNGSSVEENYPLNIQVSENPYIMPEGMQKNALKSPKVTINTLDEFYAYWMYYNNIKYFFPNNQFTYRLTETGFYENNGYWPSDATGTQGGDIPLIVFGYNDGYFIKNGNTGKPYLQVELEESTYNQIDVVVSRNTNTWNECGGTVNLLFDHICSAMQFSIQKTSSLANYTIEVSEVVLHNILKYGHFHLMTEKDSETGEYPESAWSDLDTYANFTLTAFQKGQNYLTVTENAELLNYDSDQYMFIIPQKIDPMAKGTAITSDLEKSYIEIKCRIIEKNTNNVIWPETGEGYAPLYLPFNPQNNTQNPNDKNKLKIGHLYPITISMGTALRDANGVKIFQ